MIWCIYIIKCKDGTLYTGITNNLKRRIEDHNNGSGCKFTAHRNPVKLMYNEKAPNRSEASKREAQIKRLTRNKKLDLITRK